MPRTLIAGFGNALRGDDGFGVEVIRRLEREQTLDESVSLLEVGTGGISLAQELLATYDRLIIVDAMARGGAPGTVYLLEVESVETASTVDPHLAVPARALSLAKALGVLPPAIFLVGCEPSSVDELSTELTPVVADAVDPVISHIAALTAARPDRRQEGAGT